MTHATIPTDAVDEARARFRGRLVGPTDPKYEDVRRVHNGLIDRRPALVARCAGPSDVVTALELAREHGLEVSVRGGGHNVAGRAVVDGAVMVDLAPMTGVHVDPDRRTARAGGGTTWRDFNRETQLHGLATTGGVVSTTGIAGLTLGGGLGHLMPAFGMAVDNLLSAEVVLADGRVVTASEEQEPDLFWAIRGGGGNFGVVTSFEYRLHPVATVTGGLALHPFDRAREVLAFYRDFTRDLPDPVMAFGGLVHAPDGSGQKFAAIMVCDCRPPGSEDTEVRAVKEFGPPAVDAIQPMPYEAVNQLLDAGYPKGALNYWKSSFLEELSDEAIDAMVEAFAQAPSPMDALLLEHFHGAPARVPVEATAFPYRQAGYNFAVMAQWMDPSLTEAGIAWSRETYEAMRPHLATSRYVNYLGDDEPPEEVRSAYGPNLPRLQRLKARYDPENVFRHNQNIRPAKGD